MIQGGAKFYKTLIYFHNPLFKLNVVDVHDFVISKLPSLKQRNDVELVMY